MRTTLHLVTTDDALGLAPVMDAVARRVFRSTSFAKTLAGVDVDEVIEAARRVLTERPMTPTDLGRHAGCALAGGRRLVAGVCRPLSPAARPGPAARIVATDRTRDQHAARGMDRSSTRGRLARRHRPALPACVRTGVRRRHPDLVMAHRSPPGRRPPPAEVARRSATSAVASCSTSRTACWSTSRCAAPVRFLPQYDNVFLSHDDRSRINGVMRGGSSSAGRARSSSTAASPARGGSVVRRRWRR